MDSNKKENDATDLGWTCRSRMDEILATEDELAPSSGFLLAVMDRVREEAAAPQPIPFPWKRALPGFVLAAGVFGWVGVELVRAAVTAMKEGLPATPHLPAALVQPMEQVGWVTLAMGASLASWLLARMLTGRSEYL
jgi:hypothetical protein